MRAEPVREGVGHAPEAHTALRVLRQPSSCIGASDTEQQLRPLL